MTREVPQSSGVGTYISSRGHSFLVFNGSSITAVNGKIPEVIIGRNPTSGGGTPLEDINLIQPKMGRKDFLGTASTVALSAFLMGV